MKKLLLTTCFMLLAAISAVAQDEPTYKREIGAALGLTNYIGDFNGSLMKGYQPAGGLVFRHIYSPFSALKLDLSYAQIKGSSNDVKTYYEAYKDNPYHFKRSLIDLNATYEYNFWPYGTGRDYRGAVRLTPYIFFGLGATVATGGSEKTAATANVPIGLGVKYKMGQRMNLGIEWAFHASLSDMLDGVADPYGIKSSGLFKNTDCYTTLRATVTYSFSAKCPTCNKDDW